MNIHTDASCKENIVGIGYIIRDNNETHENATFEIGDYTSIDAEYMALRKALIVVQNQLNPQMPVYCYTDCQAVVNKLKNPQSDKWRKRAEELSLIAQFDFMVRWTPRENNRKADSLAGIGRRRGATNPIAAD